MAEAGFAVVIFGDPSHREVKGVLAWAAPKGIAVLPGDSLPNHLPARLAVIAQTTQSPNRFADFLSTLIQDHVSEITELRVINTLCDVTASQQTATRDLAQEVDLMLVVGGRSSANTRHLLDICKQEGTIAHHIESSAELKTEWLTDCKRLGVTSSASRQSWKARPAGANFTTKHNRGHRRTLLSEERPTVREHRLCAASWDTWVPGLRARS
jgi:4-hydroxy-3-methylbut-2-enyl diphosphate reductase